nr:MAG TPA: hypothetical protein [Crassvirales sp.]
MFIILVRLAAYFSIVNSVVEISGFFLSCLKYPKTLFS